MEICGGQIHSLVKNGILQLLPEEVQMVHGLGCPIFVTPLHLIDKAVYTPVSLGGYYKVPALHITIFRVY